jgi:hypothetical protein
MRLTDEMLEAVIDENERELNVYKTFNPLIDRNLVRKVGSVIRNMYIDTMLDYVGDIHDEEFFYGIPKEGRSKMVDMLDQYKRTTGMNTQTYNAILGHTLSSLEYLMIVEYERAIDGDCDSIIFNVR